MSNKKKLLLGIGIVIIIAAMVVMPEVDVQISARISAEIIKIYIKEGDRVEKGQLLVELDSQVYKALKEKAESTVMSAQATLKRTEADYRRTEGLFQQNLTSQAELDAREADKLLAQSQLRQAEASLREAEDNLKKTRLLAPISGVVTKLNKEEGEIAVGSQFQADPIMTVSDLSRMEVLAEIDENDVVLISVGDTTKIEVDAIPDTVLEGRVSEIAHEATTRGRGTQEQVTNFEVKIAVISKIQRLRPGMSCTVDINTETHKDVLYVPIQCVTMRELDEDSTQTATESNNAKKQDNRKEVVFVVADGIAKMTPVTTGISDDANIEITSGLEEDQQVVSGSYKAISRDLKNGDKVKIKKTGMDEEKSE